MILRFDRRETDNEYYQFITKPRLYAYRRGVCRKIVNVRESKSANDFESTSVGKRYRDRAPVWHVTGVFGVVTRHWIKPWPRGTTVAGARRLNDTRRQQSIASPAIPGVRSMSDGDGGSRMYHGRVRRPADNGENRGFAALHGRYTQTFPTRIVAPTRVPVSSVR